MESRLDSAPRFFPGSSCYSGPGSSFLQGQTVLLVRVSGVTSPKTATARTHRPNGRGAEWLVVTATHEATQACVCAF